METRNMKSDCRILKKQGYPSSSFHRSWSPQSAGHYWFDVNKRFAHNKTSRPLYARPGGSIELSVFTIFIPPINEGSVESRKVDLSKRWGCRNVTDTLKDRWRRYGQIICYHLTFTGCDSRTDLCSMKQPSRADQSLFINYKLNFQSCFW